MAGPTSTLSKSCVSCCELNHSVLHVATYGALYSPCNALLGPVQEKNVSNENQVAEEHRFGEVFLSTRC